MLNQRKLFLLAFISILLNAVSSYAGIKSAFTYGNNKAYTGQNEVLQADLYNPTLFSTKLPVVIIYHGGGYASGDKNLAVLKIFADKFNAANISAVVPNFRQGWYEAETKGLCASATPEKFGDAAHRAYQDCRALIRYCRANANALGIDSTKIFVFGISSGGFLAMHSLYMDDNMVDADRLARLGSLDYQSNNLTNSTDIAGIISVVGGFYAKDAPILKPYPLLMFNNTCDGAVDFFNGWLGNCSNTARTYGPGIFTKTLEQYNHPYDLHVFCGYNHGFNSIAMPEGGDAEAINYVTGKSLSFIREIIDDTHTFGTHTASDSITSLPIYDCNNFETFYWCKDDSAEVGNEVFYLTPNPISCGLQPKLNIRHHTDETLYIEVVDELGKLISQQKTDYKTSQNIIFLNTADFKMGINILLLKNSKGKVLYKTKAIRYCEF